MALSSNDRIDLINALDVLIGAYGHNSEAENRLRKDYTADRPRGRRARALLERIARGALEVDC
jgi:hypothetical protein